uniref:RNA helicase n=1 Tax=Panagrolaimus sp. ES5 TaxID=591445 RepID=A0AC34F2X4_9BILA
KTFRKDFYHEADAVKNLTKKEVAKYREDNEGIKVRGLKCPKPILSWAHAGVSKTEMKILQKLDYTKPTPIQSQAIPAILSGRDVIGIAKTGSGKTLAFLLPMFRHILDQDPLDEMDGPIALIMSPTRELALQTWREAKKFATPMNLEVVCVYGGVGISEQIADLKKGAEIVVCTPGRMIDMLIANNGRVTNLRRITYLVLDEADRMFDMGFEPQVMKIINNIRPDRQTVMFSATFPKTMEALARKVLDKPVEIQVGGRSVVCKDIEQHAMILNEEQKYFKLLELLGLFWEKGSVIVFVEKQEKADDLVSKLMKSGYNCAPLHGAIDQSDRDSALIDFKQGALKLLIATSVAARGLDVKKLILVVNYDCPNHYEDYVHRVGRTGRAGNKGYAYTFILPEGQEKYAGE